eukprot:5547127-Ditylum_brightwellii.AAC.1
MPACVYAKPAHLLHNSAQGESMDLKNPVVRAALGAAPFVAVLNAGKAAQINLAVVKKRGQEPSVMTKTIMSFGAHTSPLPPYDNLTIFSPAATETRLFKTKLEAAQMTCSSLHQSPDAIDQDAEK